MSAIVPMSTLEARALTERIKSAAGDLAEMLWTAHEQKAWDALGYKSWKQYADEELRMSERYSFRLIEFVEVKNAISDWPMGQSLPTPRAERQVRPLAALRDEPEKQAAAWSVAVESANGAQPTAKQVEAAVAEVQAETEHPKRSPAFQPSNGMRYADLAMESLKKIQPNDTERDKAFMAVQRFLTQNYQAK